MEFLRIINEIQEEQRNTPGLSDFSRALFKEHLKFISRLNRINFVESNDTIAILNQVIRGIKEAEQDKKHNGVFRETNLDWAYARKVVFTQYIMGRVDKETWKKVRAGFKKAGLK